MDKLIKRLREGAYSCVVEKDGQMSTFTGMGVSDLYEMVTNRPHLLEDAAIADKVVGKAAAALMILGKVNKVYAEIISVPALLLLRNAEIGTDFGQVVSHISNRDKTGWCPLEKMCYSKESPEEIFVQIQKFRENIRVKELLRHEQI